jgi:hypothetical protein
MKEPKYLKELRKEYEYSKTLSIEDFDKRYIDEKEEWSGFYLPSHEYFLEKFLYEGNDLKPNKDCNVCDYINNYTCFDCESLQIKGEIK